MQINVPGKTASAKKEESSQDKINQIETWKKRISLLSPEEQAHIAKKYYGGHYPWKG